MLSINSSVVAGGDAWCVGGGSGGGGAVACFIFKPSVNITSIAGDSFDEHKMLIITH